MSYTLCVSLSNFLDREFFFDYELPSLTPPDYAVNSNLKEKFKILMNSRRSMVSDLISLPAKRRYEIDRNIQSKIRIDNIVSMFMTTESQRAKYKNTVMWESFGPGRRPLIKEELQKFELIEIGDFNLVNISYFYFLDNIKKKEILSSVKIEYKDEIENLSGKISRELGKFNAMHVRMGDFFRVYGNDGYKIEIERLRKYLSANITDKTLPILIATDGLQEKEIFAAILKDYKYIFIDEFIFDEYEKEFNALEFTDFNVLTIINQLLCAVSDSFIGSCRSTLTGIIHRLRQERYHKTDFNFIPDEKLLPLLSPDGKIKPDSSGFFDWNRYSVFSKDPLSAGWVREWNYDYSALGF